MNIALPHPSSANIHPDEWASRVELAVFDALGRRVATPVAALLSIGAHELPLQANSLKPGLYLVRLLVEGQPAATRQLVIE